LVHEVIKLEALSNQCACLQVLRLDYFGEKALFSLPQARREHVEAGFILEGIMIKRLRKSIVPFRFKLEKLELLREGKLVNAASEPKLWEVEIRNDRDDSVSMGRLFSRIQ